MEATVNGETDRPIGFGFVKLLHAKTWVEGQRRAGPYRGMTFFKKLLIRPRAPSGSKGPARKGRTWNPRINFVWREG